MSTKKLFTHTPDDQRITRVLQHYINAQLDDGVCATDIIVALEDNLRLLEITYGISNGDKGKNKLSESDEVSQILKRISRKAGEDIRNLRGTSGTS